MNFVCSCTADWSHFRVLKFAGIIFGVTTLLFLVGLTCCCCLPCCLLSKRRRRGQTHGPATTLGSMCFWEIYLFLWIRIRLSSLAQREWTSFYLWPNHQNYPYFSHFVSKIFFIVFTRTYSNPPPQKKKVKEKYVILLKKIINIVFPLEAQPMTGGYPTANTGDATTPNFHLLYIYLSQPTDFQKSKFNFLS